MNTSELLGPLENEVMRVMWRTEQGTVREVLHALQERRTIAYTTVMTIMNNLVTKGLLIRTLQGKAYLYSVAMTREEFMDSASREAVSEVLTRFGDLAIARFLEVTAQLDPEVLKRLQDIASGKGRSQKSEGEFLGPKKS